MQVRQDSIPLVTLKLKPRIVAKAGAGPAARLPVEQQRRGAARARTPPRDTLLIEENFVGDVVLVPLLPGPHELADPRQHFQSQPMRGRDVFITKILNRIGAAWAGTGKRQLQAFENDLKAIGATIFEELMPRERCRNCCVGAARAHRERAGLQHGAVSFPGRWHSSRTRTTVASGRPAGSSAS